LKKEDCSLLSGAHFPFENSGGSFGGRGMKKKRILSVLLSLAMVVSLMPAVTLTSSAADSEATPVLRG